MKNLLNTLGLSDAEVSVYEVLLNNTPLPVSTISKLSGESRTNTYAVLESLEEQKLTERDESRPVLRFRATNPVVLQEIASNRRQQANQADDELRDQLPSLLQTFNATSERPGVQFFEGKEGLRTMYEDVLATCQDVIVLRSPHDDQAMSNSFYARFKREKHKLGIKTHMISAEQNISKDDYSLDKELDIKRSILPKGVYEEPVEISVYGDKVATISFGTETIGTIIYSPLIASAMRQIILQLAK